MRSFDMLRPKGMDIHCSPFLDPSVLEAILSEMGKLAIIAGEKTCNYLPPQESPYSEIKMN